MINKDWSTKWSTKIYIIVNILNFLKSCFYQKLILTSNRKIPLLSYRIQYVAWCPFVNEKLIDVFVTLSIGSMDERQTDNKIGNEHTFYTLLYIYQTPSV